MFIDVRTISFLASTCHTGRSYTNYFGVSTSSPLFYRSYINYFGISTSPAHSILLIPSNGFVVINTYKNKKKLHFVQVFMRYFFPQTFSNCKNYKAIKK